MSSSRWQRSVAAYRAGLQIEAARIRRQPVTPLRGTTKRVHTITTRRGTK
jgi:hypothetical protein